MRHAYLDHASVSDRPSRITRDPDDLPASEQAGSVLSTFDEYASSSGEQSSASSLRIRTSEAFTCITRAFLPFMQRAHLLSFSRFVRILRRICKDSRVPYPRQGAYTVTRKRAGRRSEICISERSLMLNS
jgi:hypothetical protein